MGMRLYDLGRLPWRETQLIYHALARLGRPAIVVCWPDAPYMCLGYSQDLRQEVDLAYCRRRRLPVFRRAVGGGLVYLDENQVFFQVILPRREGWPRVDAVYRRCLAPVQGALADLGLPAEMRPACDLTVRGRKISGNGGGEIAGHPVVVGNILLDFDFQTMAGALAVPNEFFRSRAREMMERRLTTLRRELGAAADRGAVAAALVDAFQQAFGPLVRSEPDAALRAAMDAVAAEMSSPDWAEHEPRREAGRTLKISEGCYVRHRVGGSGLQATVVEEEGFLREVRFWGPPRPGVGTAVWEDLARWLEGWPLVSDVIARRVRLWQERAGTPAVCPEEVVELCLPSGERLAQEVR